MTFDVAPLSGYRSELGLLLATLDDSTREWRENLEEPPVEAIVWQAYPGGHSIGGLILHIADVESHWFEQFAAGRPVDPDEAKLLMGEATDQYAGKWPVPPAEPIEWYLALHDRIRARVKETLMRLDDPAQLFQGRKNRFTLRWIAAHVVEHDSYHGGQAVLMHELWKHMRSR